MTKTKESTKDKTPAKSHTKDEAKPAEKTRAAREPSVPDPETDPKQSAEAREKHNTEHVGTAEWAKGCYFCGVQQDGAATPVEVPENPPPFQ